MRFWIYAGGIVRESGLSPRIIVVGKYHVGFQRHRTDVSIAGHDVQDNMFAKSGLSGERNIYSGYARWPGIYKFKTGDGIGVSRIPESKQIFYRIFILLVKESHISISPEFPQLNYLFNTNFCIPAGFGLQFGIVKNTKCSESRSDIPLGNGGNRYPWPMEARR